MKITILNFFNGIVYIFPYDENIYDNVEDFFESEYAEIYKLVESNCQYMVSSELQLKII